MHLFRMFIRLLFCTTALLVFSVAHQQSSIDASNLLLHSHIFTKDGRIFYMTFPPSTQLDILLSFLFFLITSNASFTPSSLANLSFHIIHNHQPVLIFKFIQHLLHSTRESILRSLFFLHDPGAVTQFEKLQFSSSPYSHIHSQSTRGANGSRGSRCPSRDAQQSINQSLRSLSSHAFTSAVCHHS